ncbi:MAG: hypothetical protein FWF01_00065 [Alphaproteobacteria bacterium]|nr:hypothetical protein [Alphaproteobacteria bacterium]
MKDKVLILAYMGSGKTEAEKRYLNVLDMDFQDFKFVYDKSIAHLPLEQRKGNTALRAENPDYPGNWIDAVLHQLAVGKSIVVSPFIEHVFDAVDSARFKAKGHDVRVILAAPSKDNFQEYAMRFKNRGNNEEFIERRRAEWQRLSDLFETAKEYERITLAPGQFLDNALSGHGIRLVPR